MKFEIREYKYFKPILEGDNGGKVPRKGIQSRKRLFSAIKNV